ncbi:hypothetical protein A3F06_03095 [candidate division TM6 bacterium RIFCSPHIGHO2_12_FULL_36_22]|nr:MAG: hypothetical protein A3F06_03095 [candidate division TM6 bacterium RIFCSPHIGHO2_12_FULL_36_22]
MQKNILLQLLVISLLYYGTLYSSIDIRKASANDVSSLAELYREVCYEYFKSIYVNAYSHLAIGKEPDVYLELAVKYEIDALTKAINFEESNSVLIASDTETKATVGMLRSSKVEEIAMLLDLMFIQKKYRKMGIGKSLINASIKYFNGIHTCLAYVYNCTENQKVLKHYVYLIWNCELVLKNIHYYE